MESNGNNNNGARGNIEAMKKNIRSCLIDSLLNDDDYRDLGTGAEQAIREIVAELTKAGA